MSSKECRIIKYIFSPTLFLAKYLKNKQDDAEHKTKVVKSLNSIYLGIAIVTFILFTIMGIYDQFFIDEINIFILFISSYFLIARINEIFLAFLYDAFQKLDDKPPSTTLSMTERIKLSLKSYLELIINFGILYFYLPIYHWKDCNSPNNIIESIYFSGVTITTLGYGDFSPQHWFPQLLTIYEVFCGFILLIVCFTIYANGKGHK